ncbi:unnamed protein product, partial [Didymodactylos carnosus]
AIFNNDIRDLAELRKQVGFDVKNGDDVKFIIKGGLKSKVDSFVHDLRELYSKQQQNSTISTQFKQSSLTETKSLNNIRVFAPKTAKTPRLFY